MRAWVCGWGVLGGLRLGLWAYVKARTYCTHAHSATNVGTTVFKELLVEKKKQTERTNVHFMATA